MRWMNFDMNGHEIGNQDDYCPGCDLISEGEMIPLGDLYEQISCDVCGHVFPGAHLNDEAWQLQQYLLSGSEWDEGLTALESIQADIDKLPFKVNVVRLDERVL